MLHLWQERAPATLLMAKVAFEQEAYEPIHLQSCLWQASCKCWLLTCHWTACQEGIACISCLTFKLTTDCFCTRSVWSSKSCQLLCCCCCFTLMPATQAQPSPKDQALGREWSCCMLCEQNPADWGKRKGKVLAALWEKGVKLLRGRRRLVMNRHHSWFSRKNWQEDEAESACRRVLLRSLAKELA